MTFEIAHGLPDTARAAVLHGEGEHFCAGLDLSELQTRDAAHGSRDLIVANLAADLLMVGAVLFSSACYVAGAGVGRSMPGRHWKRCRSRPGGEIPFARWFAMSSV